MSNTNSYSSPVDFRISKQLPVVSTLTQVIATLRTIYNFAQQVIYAFNYYCGMGTPSSDQWSLFASTPARLIVIGNMEKLYVTASVNIGAGAYINLYSNSGTLSIKLAFAGSSGVLRADGFAPSAIAAGQIGLVMLKTGVNSGLTGLSIGQRYWLSATVPGGIQTAPATASGDLEQYLGIALDTDNIFSTIDYPIQH